MPVVVDVGQHINGTIYQTANTRKYLYAYNADTNQLVSQQTGYIDTPIELALFANSNIYLYGYTYWSENGSSANFTFRDDPTAIAGPTTIDVSAPSALTNFKVTDTNGQELTGFTVDIATITNTDLTYFERFQGEAIDHDNDGTATIPIPLGTTGHPERPTRLILDNGLTTNFTLPTITQPNQTVELVVESSVPVVVDVGQHIDGTIYQTANTRKYLYAYNADTNQLVSQQTGYIDTPIELALFANSNIYLYGYTYWSENGSSANFTFRDDPTAIAGPTTIDVSAPSALTNFKVTDTNGQELTGFTVDIATITNTDLTYFERFQGEAIDHDNDGTATIPIPLGTIGHPERPTRLILDNGLTTNFTLPTITQPQTTIILIPGPDGATVILDSDSDGIPDTEDNCPITANADQGDIDADGIGDVCDDHTAPNVDRITQSRVRMEPIGRTIPTP